MTQRERKPDAPDPLLGLKVILYQSPRMGVPGENHASVENFVDSLIRFELLGTNDRSEAIEYVKEHNQLIKPAKKKSSRRKTRHRRKKPRAGTGIFKKTITKNTSKNTSKKTSKKTSTKRGDGVADGDEGGGGSAFLVPKVENWGTPAHWK